MMKDFNFYAPTRVVFGREAEEKLPQLIQQYGGRKVLVHFGGGSARRSGLLDKVEKMLTEAGINYVELGGVVPNPLLSKVKEGIELCKRENVDFILAVGGGSVIDSAKAIGYGVRGHPRGDEKAEGGHPLLPGGEVDIKSMMEQTRDLFIISCWTGLRRSDINRLDKATFNLTDKIITVTAEKTKKQVSIPMHPIVVELYDKYKGHFPRLCDKSKANNHLRECARLAGFDEEVRVVENRAGEVKTLVFKKYQLVGMHTGRRSFATNMYKRRFPTIAIMRLTGHTTESNFLKYIKVTPEENAAMMAEEFFKSWHPFDEKK